MPDGRLTLVEYLQELAGYDTNRKGDIVNISIAMHPDYDLVVMPSTTSAAYFKTSDTFLRDVPGEIQISDDMLYQVDPPESEIM